MVLIAILTAGLLLAYANGANDNFKGVATLFGSGTTGYRRALWWATGTTLLGSLAAVFLAQELLHRFTGKGLIPGELVAAPGFAGAVGLGAALTVLLATRLGLPVSTTHSLVGALGGAALASSAPLDWAVIGKTYFLPLLFSPLAAMAATGGAYPALHWTRKRLGITKSSCFCVGREPVEIVPQVSDTLAAVRIEQLSASLGTTVSCRERYEGHLMGISAGGALDGLHYLSAGLLSFARGLNDTPKIAAILLMAPWLGSIGGLALCGAAIAIGGILSARRVAHTMSWRITAMNAGQGFTANLVSGLLVILASGRGLPVSTTHVSCGALFGVGTVTGNGRWAWIGTICSAWVTTVPLAALLSALAYAAMTRVG